ncbi:MAG: FAD-dependent oxidoreductase [Actinomycetota bacterium]|nr:FAD-dependent oxidoreductase [Actinomycetota bacterium]
MSGPVDAPDLLVIGGGAGGISAAQAAARRGASVLIVQDGPIGGDCTFTGCVPSKALLSAAAAGTGFDEAMARVRHAVGTIALNEDDDAMAAQGITVRHGRATFTAPGVVDVDGTTIRAKRIIVATGAGPDIPPIEGLGTIDVLTNETLFELERQPESMAVLGGGPIGVEMAQAFARLGTRITLIEAEDRVLPGEEPEASTIVASALQADAVDLRVGARLERVEPAPDGARLHLSAGAPVDVERVLVAIGRRPTSGGFGLEEIGVTLDERGFVVTDATMRTAVAGIWAVGDVTGRLQFTHAAARMGLIAADNALSRLARVRPKRFDTAAVPWVTFTDPEVAHVGMTEAQAADHDGRVATVPFDAFDRAIASGRTGGYVTLIAGPRRVLGNAGGGRLLGATIVGPSAGELVNEVALGIHTGMFAGRLAQTVHAYPTWSMALQIAAGQLFFEVDGRGHRPARR